MGETHGKKKKPTKQNKSKNNIHHPHPTNLPAPQGLAAFKPHGKKETNRQKKLLIYQEVTAQEKPQSVKKV